MRLKESTLKRAPVDNVRRLAKWLKIDADQDVDLIIEELRQQGYLMPDKVPWMPTYFRGKVK